VRRRFLVVVLVTIVVGAALWGVTRLLVDQLHERPELEYSAVTVERMKKAVALEVEAALNADARNLERIRQRLAAEDTARFINEHMATIRAVDGRQALMELSLQSVNEELKGIYCEFGVYTGGSINFIASKIPHTIHGFDSFEGLPEDWRTKFPKGAFSMDGLPTVKENVILHKGWFNESLPVWARDHKGPLAFAHMDADLFESTKTVFDILGDRFVAGSIIQFDEYFSYPGWQEGEHKALQEFISERAVSFEYIGYSETSQQVAVRILSN